MHGMIFMKPFTSVLKFMTPGWGFQNSWVGPIRPHLKMYRIFIFFFWTFTLLENKLNALLLNHNTGEWKVDRTTILHI